MTEITVAQVRELLDYDPETGILTWRESSGKQHKKRSPGKPVGYVESQGYVVVKLRAYGGSYKAHRLAWIHYHGRPPIGEVDHIDGDRANNRIANLREANDLQNALNAKLRRDSRSGVKGVALSRNCKSRPWAARVWANGKRQFVGYFVTKEQAEEAIRRVREDTHGAFANHGG